MCANVSLVDDVLSVLAEATADLVTRPVFGLSSDDVVASLVALSAHVNRVAAVQAALVRELESRDFARGQGSSSLAVWLRDRLRLSGRSARDVVALGRLLATRPQVRAAVTDGSCSAEQALVVGAVLARFPDDSAPAALDAAEAALLDQATRPRSRRGG